MPIPILLVAAALAVPVPAAPVFAAPPAAVPASSRTAAPRDTTVDVGGWRLRLDVRRGAGPLTILLEAGGGADGSSWNPVIGTLAERTGATVVAYDRSGFGVSDLGAPDLTPRDEIAAVRRALATIGAPPVMLVVGHSYGALLAMLHASLHPEDVVGLVLVDPMNPRFVETTGEFVYSTVTKPPAPSNDFERAIVRLIRGFPALIAGLAPVEPALPQPIAILTAGTGWWDARHGVTGMDAAWRASHEAMAAVPGRRLIVVEGARHDVAEARPDAIVEAVMGILP